MSFTSSAAPCTSSGAGSRVWRIGLNPMWCFKRYWLLQKQMVMLLPFTETWLYIWVLRDVVKTGKKIADTELPPLAHLHSTCCVRRAMKITKDVINPSHHLFKPLPSGRHFKTVCTHKETKKQSFPPKVASLQSSYHLSLARGTYCHQCSTYNTYLNILLKSLTMHSITHLQLMLSHSC